MFTPLARRLCAGLLLSIVTTSAVLAAEEVNVYSYRQPYLTEPVFDEFTRQTGITVNTVFAKKGLIERLENEGRNSPADLMLVANVGSLSAAVDLNLAAPVQSEILMGNIPANFRDENNHWFGLTTRARIIVTAKERVEPGLISSYADLIKPELKGRICTRSGYHPYMVELLSAIITHEGETEAEQWLAGLKANLARKPQGGDRAQVRAIAEGVCDVAILNSYYMGGMLNNPEEKPWAEAVDILFPDQQGNGTHMNISGVIMTRSSPNPDNALKLLEFLSGETAQSIYAELNHEYPVNSSVAPSALIAGWGEFQQDALSLNAIATNRNLAYRLVDEVDYDG